MEAQEHIEDAIVISGMSGKVSNSDNLAEARHQMYNKIDMISNCKRFQRVPDAPERYGAIPTIDKFDNGFFSTHENEADIMDPISRMSLEVGCEALWDAGISLEEIKSSKTSVYMGNCFDETETFCMSHNFPDRNQLVAMTKLGLADKLCHFLEIDGQKRLVDSACSSSMYCLQHAVDDLKNGKADCAIVYGHSLILAPGTTTQFNRLGVLSRDGSSKSFDRNANGYVRADSVTALVLQRAGDARRQYAEVVHVLTNCDGYKEHGITFPSTDVQMMLFEEFYSQIKMPLNNLGYMEAHGTGTKVGDPVELTAIENFFCKDRKDPLLIGAVKSNLGHSEGASGLSSIIKCCWILDSNKIPPNINFQNPNPANSGLFNGKLQVVTDVMDLPADKPYTAASNFGFGGANAHVLLTKPRFKRAHTSVGDETLTRLVCLSGRTDESIMTLYDELKSHPFDPDFIALINSAFGRKTAMLDCRGYCLADTEGVSPMEILEYRDNTLPLKCFFHTSGVSGLGQSLMKFKRFQEHLVQVNQIFSKNKIQNDLVLNNKTSEEGKIESVIVTIVVQTGIVELLKTIGIEVSTYFGSGIGELSAAYADGVLSLEQTILIAHRIVKLLRKKHPEINTNMISAEIQDISNMAQPPRKWQLQEKATVHENLSQYFSEVMFTSHTPEIKKENILIIGGNAACSKNIISLCDVSPDRGFLPAVGRLHLQAYSMDVNKLYSIQWPVKAQTPMISPLVKWFHKKSWQYVVEYDTLEVKCNVVNQWSSTDWLSLQGHNIDGRVLFPATGYLRLAWKCFCNSRVLPIKFENVSFLRACTVTPGQNLLLTVEVMTASGEFQVTENDSIVVTGRIQEIKNFDAEWLHLPPLPVPNQENIMNKRDIYKELGLRGYYYQGQFKEMQSCDVSATVAQIKWSEWCPFLDNILQMKILGEDTRSLYVPTKIRQMIVHQEKHLDIIYMSDDIENCVLPAYHYKELDILRCGYVEVRGLQAASIAKRKNPNPVLEANKFVPYVAYLELESAARVMVQVALENSYGTKIKAMEEFNAIPDSMEPMLPYIQKALNDQPLIQPELVIYSTKDQELSHIPTVNKMPASESNNFIAIGYNLSQNTNLRKTLLSSLKETGYLISREDLKTQSFINGLTIICEYTTPTERVIMMRPTTQVAIPKPIHVAADGFNWVQPLKEARINKENILIYSENEPNNGLMGLTNCLLRESGGERVMNVLIDDARAPKFNVNTDFYKRQLQKNLAINVLKNGVWGSYRHLLINENITVPTRHTYANNTIRGDLSSLTWIQGKLSIPERFNDKRDGDIIHIYTCAVNFKDVMFASGKLIVDSVITERMAQDSSIGFESAGRSEDGRRVMALSSSGMFANVARVGKHYMWEIPDHWTIAEAATVPCVYLTNIYGLITRAQIREGDSILIHSATGGIGLSAINIAMYYKCNIFLTVGTAEKKEYIIKNYPSIPAEHIGNSRDTSFYEMILRQTHGKGVSIILNSLADEKLQASVKCLSEGGRFVEIGKFDCSQDSPLRLDLAEKEAEYHGVMLDFLMSNSGNIMTSLGSILTDGIAKGFVKPIPHVAFSKNQLEAAFRYMITGKHIGKAVVTIREEEAEKRVIPKLLKCDARPKLYCNPLGTYILLGGLGGFGLELADLLVLRGAKNLVLVSRRGITSGYQQLRIKLWKSYGCEVKISTEDSTTREGCLALLEEAQTMGDVVGIFNLAVVLRDAVFENQTEETFLESYNPKAQSTIYLDELSRALCPRLEHFVVFSSVSCGRGNAGQTNYGYSNSVMERVCENRKNAGLPGKAIQWGVIGDVGIVADYKEQNVEIVIGGTMHQRIANCLEVLDVLLSSEDAIVSSMVVAEKIRGGDDDDVISVVAKLLQINDIKTVSPNSSFPELGMDSMMAVEIKQTLERDFDVFLSPQELRNMNLARLAELTSGGEEAPKEGETSSPSVMVQHLLRFVPEENKCNIPLVNMKNTNSPVCLFLMPGIEGMATVFEPLAENLKISVKCLQFPCDNAKDTMEGLVQQKYEILKKELDPRKPFLIGAHSMGVTVALETVTLLERDGYTGTLLILDGSPSANKSVLSTLIGSGSDETVQTALILNIMSSLLPLSALENLKNSLVNAGTFKEKCQLAIDASPDKTNHSNEFLHNLLTNMYYRVKSELAHQFTPRSYKSKIILCKAAISVLSGLPEDFGLREIVGKNLEIKIFQGDHISFLSDKNFTQCVEDIANNN